MKKPLEIGVIGLGIFGWQLGKTLTGLGHGVIGVDIDEHKARQVQDDFTQTYIADATDKNALTELRFQDLDLVVLCVGSSIEASILITLNLQEIGIRKIIAKANGSTHRKLLSRLGVGQIIQPEADAAELTAKRIDNPSLLEQLPMGGEVLVLEMEVKDWAGKSLAQLDARSADKVLVAAIRKVGQENFSFVPDPLQPLAQGDRLLIMGNAADVNKLKI